MLRIKVNAREVLEMLEDAQDVGENVMADAYTFLRKKTPIDKGNARSRTRLKKRTTIHSDYAYAGRLDEGWSKQAPNGFTDPTIDEIDKLVDREVRRLNR